MKLTHIWDLKRFYSKSEDSNENFNHLLKSIHEKIISLQKELEGKCKLLTLIEKIESISAHLKQMSSYISCLSAQNTRDPIASQYQDRLSMSEAEFETALALFDTHLLALSDQDFEAFLLSNKERAFSLAERRHLGQSKLSLKEERLINSLAIDGYHGWNQMWESLMSETLFYYQGNPLSFGQIENKLSDQNEAVRQEAFSSIQTSFKGKQNSFAETLNHLGGFRLKVYGARKAASFLQEALEKSRMQEKTLNAMWEAVENFQPHLLKYLKCKAGLLKKEKLSWYDLEVGESLDSKNIPYEKAASLIHSHFKHFSPKLASFAKHALENHWVEAEDRPFKAPGGFCTPFPIKKESRIFMTYAGTVHNFFTLAHELGHAFHDHIIFDMPEMNQNFPMNLAETASTLGEEIVSRATILEAKDKKEKRALLDDQLIRATSYLMNIFARFLFEKEFYSLRSKEYVSAEHLNQLMIQSQQRAYGNALQEYHPLFWAGKMHFFFSDTPFYNFPYTFGYLLSQAIYELSTHSPNFEAKYIDFLKDTGQMDVETLAHKHFQFDLSSANFWQNGLNHIKKDIDDYVSLS